MGFTKRTVQCGEINKKFLGKMIAINGWVNKRRDHGALIFVDVRDRSGLVQVVFNEDVSKQMHEAASDLHAEDVVAISGIVIKRSPANVNKELSSGEVEIQANSLQILNAVSQLPFTLDDAEKVEEELRLKYRYLDLRRSAMFNRLKLRSDVEFAMREFLHQEEFIDIETPILTKNTPEGAREFVSPSRVNVGKFYALPQSPQLYKQLLMAGGVEKYYQIARCFRDEASRADRQIEFTQLDLEMSFVDEKDVQNVTERMLQYIFKKVLNKNLEIPFSRMSYDQAFEEYGSDKPDVRFGLKIYDCTDLFESLNIKFLHDIIMNEGKVGALAVPHIFTRSELDKLEQRIKEFGAQGLLWIKVGDKLESSIAKFLPQDFSERLHKHIPSLKKGDTLLLIAGGYKNMWPVLGRLRLDLGKELKLFDPSEEAFLWVTDFPMFEYDKEQKSYVAVHHPFTQPQPGWESLEKEKIKARAYDLVLNGIELGGGSVRIHTRELQSKVFDILGITKEDAKKRFGFLLEAQKFGFPPHGGLAIGLDRFIMILAGCNTIRDVIAFPKTARGYDPLMNSPTELTETELAEYGLMRKKSKS